MALNFLRQHLVMIPLKPCKPGFSVVEGKDITLEKVYALTVASDAYLNAIMKRNLDCVVDDYKANFKLHTECSGHAQSYIVICSMITACK